MRSSNFCLPDLGFVFGDVRLHEFHKIILLLYCLFTFGSECELTRQAFPVESGSSAPGAYRPLSTRSTDCWPGQSEQSELPWG